MQKLYIIGAGGFGREVLGWARQCPLCGSEWIIGGFIDDNNRLIGKQIHGVEVVSNLEDYYISGEEVFICAIGDPEIKKKICSSILDKGGKFINIIHPSVVLGHNVQIGSGVILCPNVVITCDVTISNFVTINIGTTIGHDSYIGSWATISPGCNISGGAVLKEGSFLGSNVTILPKAQVGAYSTVGAGGTVLKRVADRTIVFGNPASEIMKK